MVKITNDHAFAVLSSLGLLYLIFQTSVWIGTKLYPIFQLSAGVRPVLVTYIDLVPLFQTEIIITSILYVVVTELICRNIGMDRGFNKIMRGSIVVVIIGMLLLYLQVSNTMRF